jgi:hypothetical protein
LQNRIVCRASLLEDNDFPTDYGTVDVDMQFLSEQPV